MNPTTLGNIQCLDVENQCFYGRAPFKVIAKDKNKEQFFEDACAQREGSMIRCCPPELVNIPYQPGPLEMPIHVQLERENQYKACPETIKASCFRERKRDQPLCINGVCNDAGYRLASNYYELCKSYQISDTPQDILDCEIGGCWGNRFRLPEEIDITTSLPTQKEVKKLESLQHQYHQDIHNLKQRIEELKETESKVNLIPQLNLKENFNGDDEILQLEKELEEKKKELETIEQKLKMSPEYCSTKPGQYCFTFDFLKTNGNYNIKYAIIILSIISIILIFINIKRIRQFI